MASWANESLRTALGGAVLGVVVAGLGAVAALQLASNERDLAHGMAVVPDRDRDLALIEKLEAELDRLRGNNAALAEDRNRLKDETEALRHDIEALKAALRGAEARLPDPGVLPGVEVSAESALIDGLYPVPGLPRLGEPVAAVMGRHGGGLRAYTDDDGLMTVNLVVSDPAPFSNVFFLAQDPARANDARLDRLSYCFGDNISASERRDLVAGFGAPTATRGAGAACWNMADPAGAGSYVAVHYDQQCLHFARHVSDRASQGAWESCSGQ